MLLIVDPSFLVGLYHFPPWKVTTLTFFSKIENYLLTFSKTEDIL
nr:MAG TPA: hypothetical protein [Bacteriophage sp.]DAW00039.1 MAG TPA: hypothetical protein [Caudoviricetes sp.]